MASLGEAFLGEGNVAGKNMLKLCARGSAIISEMLRLSENIPSAFQMHEKDARYAQVLLDYQFFKNEAHYDSRISADQALIELDDEVKENNLGLIVRFYNMFESIHKFVMDLLRYLGDVEEGVYVSHTLDRILLDVDGKQLMSEALYLYGMMLWLLDLRIDGQVRERLIVAYYRYKNMGNENFMEVKNLCGSTGFKLPGPSDKSKEPIRPKSYPESYFGRIPLPKKYVESVLGRLRSDDVYQCTQFWPSSEHRSNALANQASMIVIILFFAPDILHKQDTIMREVVDKHFADNWVVAYYMGYTIDLSMYWEPYKAAKTAIGNTCKPQSVKELAAVQASRIPPLIKDCVRYLTEGVLTDELVLDNTAKLLQHLRCCNAAVRWVLLHKSGSNPKLKEFVQTIPTQETLSLLLKTADLEDKMKNIHDRLLEGKEARWTECKTESIERMKDLCDYFGGKTALSRGVKADEKMAKWFGNLGSEIGALDSSDPLLAGRKIQQLQSALKEVEQFHQIDTNTSVKNYLAETCEFLKQMLRTVNVRDETTSTLAKISDFGYAFEIIHEFLDTFHAQIKQDPFSVLLLRATFLKIVSVIDVPLLRFEESESADLKSVAQYYSSHIVAFIRLCLEVVPVTMFRILTDQILTNSSSLKAVPTRFDRALLKDFAQVEERFKLAAATYQVSVFTDGVLAMRTTLVGSIPVNPKELLEDGIRKELVRQISIAMHGILIFRTGKTADFEANLERLEQQLQNFRKSFEYISDYVNIYGLKIWQEEFGRIISFNVEQECNTFLKQKVYEWQSQWQNAAIPIPSFPSIQDDISRTFMGRLIREILHQTDPRRSVYIETRYSWYALDGKEILGIRGFNKLHKSVSTIGLCGLDKLLSFMIVEKLQTFVKAHRREAAQGGLREMFSQMQSELTPTSCISVTAPKLYSVALQRMSKLIPALYSAVTFVGQAQLLRRVFASELNFGAQLDSNLLYSCLGVLNGSVLNDLRDHYRHPDQKPYPQDASTLLPDISSFLDAAGLASPIHKIYIATEPLDGFALAMFLFTISQMPKFAFDKQLECLVCRDKKEPMDGAILVAGIITLLKQFHSSNISLYLAFLAQYIRNVVTFHSAQTKEKQLEIPADVINILHFLEIFIKLAHIDRGVVQEHIPSYLFDKFRK